MNPDPRLVELRAAQAGLAVQAAAAERQRIAGEVHDLIWTFALRVIAVLWPAWTWAPWIRWLTRFNCILAGSVALERAKRSGRIPARSG